MSDRKRVWEEIEPGRWAFRYADPWTWQRSTLPCPHVISDNMPETEQVDGKFYTSKREFRAVGRALGLTEVGTENLKRPPKRRSSLDPKNIKTRRETLQRAFARRGER